MTNVQERAPATGTRSSQSRGLRLALLAAVVSGVAVYVNGQAVRRFPSPTVYTTGKNLIAGAVLVCFALLMRRWSQVERRSEPIAGSAVAGLGAVAVIGGAVPFVLFFEGLAQATSSDAAFIHKTLVVWVALLAVLVLGETLTVFHVAAVALLVLGQVMLAGGVGSIRPGAGEAMILLATLCWAVELLLVKRLVVSVPSTTVAAARIAGGAVLLIVWVAVTGRLDSLVSLTASQLAWLMLTGSLLSVFVSVWFAAVAKAQVVDVAAILVPGAVITGLLQVGAGGGIAVTQVSGWILMLVAVVVLIAIDARQDPRRATAAQA
jgi:drug/metabolite transporter (DMT)-like permease